ncbi:hypothetical protein ACO0QE_003750 [Hanseniaspora vineae]
MGSTNASEQDTVVFQKKLALHTKKLEREFKLTRTKRVSKSKFRELQKKNRESINNASGNAQSASALSVNKEVSPEPMKKSLLNDVHFTSVGSILDIYVDGPIKKLFQGPLSDKRIEQIRERNNQLYIKKINTVEETTKTSEPKNGKSGGVVEGEDTQTDENVTTTTKTTTTTTETVAAFETTVQDIDPTVIDASVDVADLLGQDMDKSESGHYRNAHSLDNEALGKEIIGGGVPADPKQLIHQGDLEDLYGGNSEISSSLTDFSGFFVLGWIACFFFVLKNLYVFYSQHGFRVMESEIWQYMSSGLFKVAAFDLMMYLSTYFTFAIQMLCYYNYLDWSTEGKYIVAIYEVVFLFGYLVLAQFYVEFHWIAKIFIFLHSTVLLMKMHSYSFYNGYLWNLKQESDISKELLQFLKDHDELNKDNSKILEKSVEYCDSEIKSQSPKTNDPLTQQPFFPESLTFGNFFEFSMFPTLVYQITYPRNNKIRKFYVFEKLSAIFGIIFVMMTVAQIFMYPAAVKAMELESYPNSLEKWKLWVFACIDMIPGFICMYLLTWYLIWDAILNCIAELTRFADRNFYGDWWNSVSWNDFSKHWNIPVHQFLLRHVYHASMSFWKFNKVQAVLFTFILSSIFHELAMYAMFNKIRYYIFFFQMFQLPLTWFHYTLFVNNPVLGNCFFWFSICCGPTTICCLYLTF